MRDNVSESIVLGGTRTVTFRVPGDDYVVTGSGPELGQWNPMKAPRAVNGEIRIELPSQTVFVYKPVRIGEDGSVTWADGDNREIFTNRDWTVDVAF